MGKGTIQARNFLDHYNRWKDCTQCDLCEGRRNVVLARGKIPCHVLFLGEGPGLSEDVAGKPFCGPAGKLLDEQINYALDTEDWISLDYPRIAISNVIACIPRVKVQKLECPRCWHSERFSGYESSSGEDLIAEQQKFYYCNNCGRTSAELKEYPGNKIHDPPKYAVEACSNRLNEIYNLCRPKKVVCVGKVAAKWIPKVLDVAIENTIEIAHPASILRAPIAKKALMSKRVCVQLRDLFEELEQ